MLNLQNIAAAIIKELNVKRDLEVGQKVHDLNQSFLWVVISRGVCRTLIIILLNPVLVLLLLVQCSLHVDGIKPVGEVVVVLLKGGGNFSITIGTIV
jgi:hypothetical protein